MAIESINIIGTDSSWLAKNEKQFLSKLMAHILYHELDQAILMLMDLDNTTLINLGSTADKLIALCDIVIKVDESEVINDSLSQVFKLLHQLSDEQMEKIREEWF